MSRFSGADFDAEWAIGDNLQLYHDNNYNECDEAKTQMQILVDECAAGISNVSELISDMQSIVECDINNACLLDDIECKFNGNNLDLDCEGMEMYLNLQMNQTEWNQIEPNVQTFESQPQIDQSTVEISNNFQLLSNNDNECKNDYNEYLMAEIGIESTDFILLPNDEENINPFTQRLFHDAQAQIERLTTENQTLKQKVETYEIFVGNMLSFLRKIYE